MRQTGLGILVDTELTEAVEISGRSYRLLRWLDGAIKSGFVSLEHAGEYVTDPDVAEAWLAKHFHDLPMDARPQAQQGQQLRRYANYFSTYLKSSFDLHEAPGARFVNTDCCPQCGVRIDKPHLQPKKLTKRDKANARVLKRMFVQNLAKQQGCELDQSAADAVVEDPDHAREVALGAYGLELKRRIQGVSSGPATLALWREVAWNTKGSPIRSFRLSAEDISAAEQRLAEFLGR